MNKDDNIEGITQIPDSVIFPLEREVLGKDRFFIYFLLTIPWNSLKLQKNYLLFIRLSPDLIMNYGQRLKTTIQYLRRRFWWGWNALLRVVSRGVEMSPPNISPILVEQWIRQSLPYTNVCRCLRWILWERNCVWVWMRQCVCVCLRECEWDSVCVSVWL